MEDPSQNLLNALKKFLKHVDNLEAEEDQAGNGFNREYRTLREIAAKNKEDDVFPASHGKMPCNIKKNRYRDIVPFDSCRVILEEIEGVEGSDYINASYVLNVHNNPGYIASQGPLANTIDDFWRMIWEGKVKVVVMACKEIESRKRKCAKYWPDEGEEEDHGNIHVTFVEEDWLADDCAERKIAITRKGSNERWIVTQYHYTGWPDHGIPDDRDVILTMMAKMRQIRSQDKDFAPVVVHCSAGCGRTGTICAIDYTWDVLKSGKLDSSFSMYEVVLSMREQRQSMIQTPDQYELAHLCVQELFQKHVEVIDENIYANISPQADESYFNLKLSSDSEDKEVDPYETLSVWKDDSAANECSAPKSNLRQKSSILEKDALATVDYYVNVGAEGEDNLSNPNPQISGQPILIPDKVPIVKNESKTSEETTTKSAKQGYANVFKAESYENTDEFSISLSSKEKAEKAESLPPKPEIRQKPALDQFSKPLHSGPVFQESPEPVQKSGPVFEVSVPYGQSDGRVPVAMPKQGPTFEEYKPPPTNDKQKPQYVSQIICSTSGSKVSYIDNQKGTTTSTPQVSQTSQNSQSLDTTSSSTNSGLTTAPQVNQNSHPYSEVSHENKRSVDSDVYSLAYDPNSQVLPPLASPEDEQRVVGNMYSQVNKHTNFSQSMGPTIKSVDVYESIAPGQPIRPARPLSDPSQSTHNNAVDGLYTDVSEQGDMSTPPVLPERLYRQEEENKADVSSLEKNKGTKYCAGHNPIVRLKNNMKDKFGRGGTDDTNIDTSYIPGFQKRIGKKPGGPKEKPNFWKKILK